MDEFKHICRRCGRPKPDNGFELHPSCANKEEKLTQRARADHERRHNEAPIEETELDDGQVIRKYERPFKSKIRRQMRFAGESPQKATTIVLGRPMNE